MIISGWWEHDVGGANHDTKIPYICTVAPANSQEDFRCSVIVTLDGINLGTQGSYDLGRTEISDYGNDELFRKQRLPNSVQDLYVEYSSLLISIGGVLIRA